MHLERILVDSEALRETARKLHTIVTSINGIEDTMERMVNESENTWKGKAQEEAAASFEKVKQRADELKEQLTQRAESIEAVCAAYENTEQKNESYVGTLSLENIFG